MSRKREPTNEEMRLWGAFTRSIRPLEKRVPAPPLPDPKHPAKAKAPPAKKPRAAPAPAAPARPSPPPKTPGLNPLDRRTRSRLARGSVAIDRRIDLHGLTQAAAHQRLRDFLAGAQADGARVVLVITGKGGAGEDNRGVLRRMVPAWLAATDLRAIVVGFDEAGRGHGGSGALYVRIRRKR